MSVDGSNESDVSDGSNTPRSRPHRDRNRWRRKHRKRNNSTPTSLQLGGDHESDDDYRECYSRHQPTSKSLPLPWTNDLHQDFVKAILDIGIEESSPAVIAEQMITKNNYNIHENDDDDEDDDDHSSEEQDETDGRSSSRASDCGNTSPITMAATLACTINNNTSSSNTETKRKNHRTDLPQECLYYKRELTGERLKSHLQILRKQRVREMEIFSKDYQRCLLRLQAIDREQKEVREKEQQQREKHKKRRKVLKRKRSSSQRPPTLLDASAFDLLDDLSRTTGVVVVGGQETNGDGEGDCQGGTLNNTNANDDVTKEEEERLLSLYLPPRSSVTLGSHRYHDEFEFDSENYEFDKRNDAFPVGGRAIGMLTWAVQQHENVDRTKRKLRRIQKQKQMAKQRQQQQHLSPFEDSSIAWETNSVHSWTSHTTIHDGKLVAIPDRCCRKGGAMNSNDHVGDSLNREDPNAQHGACEEEEKDDNDDDDSFEYDPFRVSIPTLTEAEKNSPLGLSMRLTWDMIKHMHSVIAEERASKLREQQQQAKLQQPRRKRQSLKNGGDVTANTQNLANFSEYETPLPALGVMDSGVLPLDPGSSKAKPTLLNDNFLGVGTHESVIPLAAQNPSTATDSAASSIDPVTNTHILAAVAANGPPPANLMAALGGAVFAGLFSGKPANSF